MQKANNSPAKPKSSKRSVFGLLFNPRLGSSIAPLRDSTRMFIHLIAAVFSVYGLFPKTHPALRDDTMPLSLREVIGTAWNNVEFTREGSSKAIIFFAVTGIIFFSGIVAIGTLFSLFMGHAHAATPMANASAFAPETSDLAQSWLDYLFNNGTFLTDSDDYGNGTVAYLQNPFYGSGSLQAALISALAFYSDAILVVAALILFYHLTSMVVETAHHGVPMGKRASQIWAPIRLVVAIGLLVPINGGLSCGQYIVIKVAELGSGLASQTWDIFLTQLVNYNSQSVPPAAPIVDEVVLDLIKMQACKMAWNAEVSAQTQAGSTDISGAIIPDPTGVPFSIGNVTGTKFSYSSNAVGDTDICGWYFVPDYGNADQVTQAASQKESQARSQAMSAISRAANDIMVIVNYNLSQGQTTVVPDSIALNNDVQAAIGAYHSALATGMQSLTVNQGNLSQALQNMKKYGWVMAGSFLNTVSRLQAILADAAANILPVTHAPNDNIATDKDNQSNGIVGRLRDMFQGIDNGGAWDVHKSTSRDLHQFDQLIAVAINKPPATNNQANNASAQCAAMIGLTTANADGNIGGLGSKAETYIFQVVDTLGSNEGLWKSGAGVNCPGVNNAPQGFALGVQINNRDPIAQMAFLGHSNLNVAFSLAAIGGAAYVAGAATSWIPYVGKALSGVASGFAGLLFLLASIFFTCGFILAYLVPLMPFLHFFFSVLSWVVGIIEAVVAIPLVALAHLNPEGDGLPGQSASRAYFFVFNLFLRPVLTIFGLICGLIIFLIALSFLNYAYAIAVSSGGGTAYGHAALSKIIYSVLYVGILYVCANHSFQLVNHFPTQALNWMGASSQAMANMGDTGKIEAITGTIGSLAGAKAIEQIGKGAGGLAGIIKKPDPTPPPYQPPTPPPPPPDDDGPALIPGGRGTGGTPYNPIAAQYNPSNYQMPGYGSFGVTYGPGLTGIGAGTALGANPTLAQGSNSDSNYNVRQPRASDAGNGGQNPPIRGSDDDLPGGDDSVESMPGGDDSADAAPGGDDSASVDEDDDD